MARTAIPLRSEDYGFFGPGSVSWKVWTSPSSIIGFQRAVVLEHFDPDLTAAVADSAKMYRDPASRLDGTLAYFLIVATADGRTAVEASKALMRVHTPVTGVEPISGSRYSANNPTSQLWIHITGWHSVLTCYQRYAGPLTLGEVNQFWAEARVAAELQTCKPADIPASRDEVRDYFADVRGRLCTSEAAEHGMRYLLFTPRDRGLRLWAGSRIVAPAAIATLPKWMRRMGGYDQPAVLDATVAPAARALVRGAAAFNSRGMVAIARRLVPRTADVLAQHFAMPEVAVPHTVTPAQAREQFAALHA